MNSMNQEVLAQGGTENLVEMANPMEDKDERAERMYKCLGGPLMGWLFEEARRRGDDRIEVAGVMGVTIGYLNQLVNGQRATADLSQKSVESCARYLGVPPIVVKLIGGDIKMSDFLFPGETQEVKVDRAIQKIAIDPRVQQSMPVDLMSLPLDAKKAIIFLHQQYNGVDFFETKRLPNLVHWLQRAAVGHDEAEYQARAGHRDTASR